MLKRMRPVVLFAALPGICSAGEPPVPPPLEIPVLMDSEAIRVDGKLSDWRLAIGPPMLTELTTWQDPTVGDAVADYLYPFYFEVWIGIKPPDRVLLAVERRDDAISSLLIARRDRGRSGRPWRDGQFEFMIEVTPQDVAADAATAQRVEVLPFAQGGPSFRYTGAVGDWRNSTEYIHGATVTDTLETGIAKISTRVEVSLTVFDVVSDTGPGESVRSDLKVGDAINLGVLVVDTAPCERCVQVSTHPCPQGAARALQEDASSFGPAVLTGLEPTDTQLSPARWGQIKRLLRW